MGSRVLFSIVYRSPVRRGGGCKTNEGNFQFAPFLVAMRSKYVGGLLLIALVFQFNCPGKGLNTSNASSPNIYATSKFVEERDKATHRANRAYSVYDPDNISYSEFTVQAFNNGLHFPADTYLNFEDWRAGTFPLTADGNMTRRSGQHKAHFNSVDFEYSTPEGSLGDLLLYDDEILEINTTQRTANLFQNGTKLTLTGFTRFTKGGTRITIFNFRAVHFGARVNVTVAGMYPLVLLSRSSIVVNTKIVIPFAQLGGWYGCDGFSTEQIENGPGANPARVYMYTIVTNATDINEIQQFRTSATQGQNLGGGVTLSFRGDTSSIIPHDSLPSQVKSILETDLPRLGKVAVSRSWRSNEGGYIWNVTFLSTVGNMPQMTITNNLTGVGSYTEIVTLQNGNTIGGTYTVSFLNNTSRNIPFDASAAMVRQTLLEDIPALIGVWVRRTDSTGAFNEQGVYTGPCEASSGRKCTTLPEKTGGFKWTITLSTTVGIIGRRTPETAKNTTPAVDMLTVSSSLTGIGANVYAIDRHTEEIAGSLKGSSEVTPFVLNFGGAGASYVSRGGKGHANNPAGNAYVQQEGIDLQGGTGGACGGDLPLTAINSGHLHPGYGGHGSGVIEIVAVNDLTLGLNGSISAVGQDGADAYQAGGGGSGGTIYLVAGGSMRIDGKLNVTGGRGGRGIGKNAYPGGGGAGGRIILNGITAYRNHTSILRYSGGLGNMGSPEHNKAFDAMNGSFFQATTLKLSSYIDLTNGAFGTKRSLILRGAHRTTTTIGVIKDEPMPLTGLQYSFLRDYPQGIQPMRVTFFWKIDAYTQGLDRNNVGAYFALHPLPSEVSMPQPPGPFEDIADNQKTTSGGEVLIGIAVMNGHFMHAANYDTLPGIAMDSKDALAQEFVERDRWYKVDVLINWFNQTYMIRIDDNVRVIDRVFRGKHVSKLGFYAYEGAKTWYDEIFVGKDFSAGFRCPISIGNKEIKSEPIGLDILRPFETGWGVDAVDDDVFGRTSAFFESAQHVSHLKRRNRFKAEFDYGGVLPNSGPLHKKFRTDVKTFSPDGDKDIIMGTVDFSVLMFDAFNRDEIAETTQFASQTTGLPGGGGAWIKPKGAGSTGRYYWFGEHHGVNTENFLNGSVSACSTVDFVTWRNEGTVLHFSNITDDEGYGDNVDLIIERPKVLFNPLTKKYVMWMHLDDKKNITGSRGLAAVAISDFPNGPYQFVKSFRPDQNETHDMTVIQDANGVAHLARTYYATTSYFLPEPVMQPMWESVKFPNGTCNYGLNYHRSFYSSGYDDNDDICNQRLRKEDKAFKYVKPSEECMAQPDFLPKLHKDQKGSIAPHMFNRRDAEGKNCKPTTYGMGPPYFPEHAITDPVKSRFKYPNKTENNFWMPSSVPTVKPQPWVENYEDGNIADNPTHSTIADELIGPTQLVHMRRTKYVAISRLQDDYLGITNWMNIIEGEAADMASLSKIVDLKGYLGWAATDEGSSSTEPIEVWGSDSDQQAYTTRTRGLPEKLALKRYTEATGFDKPSFAKVEPDWYNRHWQYTTHYNDRVDSPVNFKDQINGRRQWHGRQGPNTLVDRSERRPIDRNCFRDDHIPEPWMNQVFLPGQMFRYQGTWSKHESRGGPEGSSTSYDYDSDLIYKEDEEKDNSMVTFDYHSINHPKKKTFGDINNNDGVWKNVYGVKVRDSQGRMVRGSGPWTYSVGQDDPKNGSADASDDLFEGYDRNHFIDPRWTYEKGLDGFIEQEQYLADHPELRGCDPNAVNFPGMPLGTDAQGKKCTPLPYEYYVEYFETEKKIYLPYGDGPFTWEESQLKELPCESSIDANGNEYCARTAVTPTPDACKKDDPRSFCCVGCEEGPNGYDVKDYTLNGGPPEHSHTSYVGTHVYSAPSFDLGPQSQKFPSTNVYPDGPYEFQDPP